MSASSEMKKLRRALQRTGGFTVAKTRGGHWRFEHPEMSGPVFAPDSPSDYRGVRNLLAELRRRTRALHS